MSPARRLHRLPGLRRYRPQFALSAGAFENIDGGLGRLGGSLHRVLPARSEMVTTLTNGRFTRPNIQIYDAHVVDLYKWVCARFFVGVKGAETKASAVKLGSRPNFRKDYAGFPNPVPPRSNPGVSPRNTQIYLIFQ